MESKTRKINTKLELTYDEIRALPAEAFSRSGPVSDLLDELRRRGFTVAEKVEDETTIQLDAMRVGDTVAIYSRGNIRLASVVKIGRTKITAAYVTPSGIEEAQAGAFYRAGRTEPAVRSYYAGWSDISEEDLQKRVNEALELGELCEREGWAAVVNVSTKAVDPTDVWAVKRQAPKVTVETNTEGLEPHVAEAVEKLAQEMSSPAFAEALEAADRLVDDPIDELSLDQELESAIEGDAAVKYLAETVRARLEAGVVDPDAYLLEWRHSIDEDELKIDELGEAGVLQADQVVEKFARIERKRAVLQILGDALSSESRSKAVS